MVFQFKGPGGGTIYGPYGIMTEATNGVDFGFGTILPGVVLPRGVWVQIALDVLWSSDPSVGAYRLWADAADGRGLQPAGDKVSIATFPSGAAGMTLHVGPYQTPSAVRLAAGPRQGAPPLREHRRRVRAGGRLLVRLPNVRARPARGPRGPRGEAWRGIQARGHQNNATRSEAAS